MCKNSVFFIFFFSLNLNISYSFIYIKKNNLYNYFSNNIIQIFQIIKMKMLIFLSLLLYINSSIPNEILRQECKLTMPTESSDCNSITDVQIDKNYKCCYISFYFHNEKVKYCNYLEYKMRDLLRLEKETLEDLYNAKSVDIDCLGNYLYNRIRYFILLFIFYIL